MNYEKIYKELISSRKVVNKIKIKGMETHHIVPRHAGGDDNPDNLVHLTRKEHRLAHRLLFKIHGRQGDYLAYKFFLGITDELMFEYRSMAGKIGGKKNKESGFATWLGKTYGPQRGRECVENGHLDRIRLLVDKEVQAAAASRTGKQLVADGRWDEIQEASWKANSLVVWSEERRDRQRKLLDEIRPRGQALVDTISKAVKTRSKLCEVEIMARLAEAPRLILEKKHPAKKSKYLWISHEGITFNSPQEMGHYYGFKPYEIENFCKRSMYGFSRIHKPTTV